MAKIETIAYIPALHKGYMDFFKKNESDKLYILGEDLVRQVPRMERDIRALPAETVKQMVIALGIFKTVEVLDKINLRSLLPQLKNVVMPDEDVSHDFADKYLASAEVTFAHTFLRWDLTISTTEFEVPPQRKISLKAFDKEMIAQAFGEAAKSPDWWRQVGAIVTKEGKPLLLGYNKPLPSKDYTFGPFGDPRSNFDAGVGIELSKVIHAESSLIAEAARRGISLEGTSIYATTFPCPVCAKLIATAGIKKVYYSKGYSLLDAEDILKAYDIEIILVRDD